MSTDEVIDLLTLMASYDRRKVGEADVAAWYAAVGDLAFGDSRDAVIAHYRECTDWLMPAHVRQRVGAVRQERLRIAGPVEIPEELADRPIEARDWKQRTLDAIADGQVLPRQIGAGS